MLMDFNVLNCIRGTLGTSGILLGFGGILRSWRISSNWGGYIHQYPQYPAIIDIVPNPSITLLIPLDLRIP